MDLYNQYLDLRGKKVKDGFHRLLQTSGSYVYNCHGYYVDSLNLTSSYSNTSSYSEVTNIIHVTSMSYADSVRYDTSSIVCNNNATTSVFQHPSSIYNSLFVNYLLQDGTNFRAGNVVMLYTTESVKISETSTTDIGNVNDVHIISFLSASSVNLAVINNGNNDFIFKYHCETL